MAVYQDAGESLDRRQAPHPGSTAPPPRTPPPSPAQLSTRYLLWKNKVTYSTGIFNFFHKIGKE